MEIPLETLQYPVGRFSWPNEISHSDTTTAIDKISRVPGLLRMAVSDLNDNQLDTCYRPGGWTIRQVVHHVADSHMNAYIRFKLALTEETPTIKLYEEAKWAELADNQLPPEISLGIIENIHQRLVTLMRNMSPTDWDCTFFHPQFNKVFTLRQIASLYQWHGDHHLAHITTLVDRMMW